MPATIGRVAAARKIVRRLVNGMGGSLASLLKRPSFFYIGQEENTGPNPMTANAEQGILEIGARYRWDR
jgi:hypothetical protein